MNRLAKLLFGLLIVVLVAVTMSACGGTKSNPTVVVAGPPQTFPSVDEMRRWGETSPSWGRVSGPYNVGEHSVYVVNIMRTSGFLSSELSFYAEDNYGRGVRLTLFQPIKYASFNISVVDDVLVCERLDDNNTRVPVLTITRHQFEYSYGPGR
jgi:hypothetical protein